MASASERAAVRTPSYERREQRERIRPEAAGPNLGLPHRKQLASWASTSRVHLGGPVKQTAAAVVARLAAPDLW